MINFIDYVMSFYGPGGLYQMSPPATVAEVQAMTLVRKRHTKDLSWAEVTALTAN